ncbi:hypothetical protein AAUPMB_21607, partial [Pasteurella multocida subsp. multocida str. Anand1_buffalo]
PFLDVKEFVRSGITAGVDCIVDFALSVCGGVCEAFFSDSLDGGLFSELLSTRLTRLSEGGVGFAATCCVVATVRFSTGGCGTLLLPPPPPLQAVMRSEQSTGSDFFVSKYFMTIPFIQ